MNTLNGRATLGSCLEGWQWYDLCWPSVDANALIWYDIPRRKMFHPHTYNPHPSPQIMHPSSVLPFGFVQHISSDDRWNPCFYVITSVLCVVMLVFMYRVYSDTHGNEWFDMVSGTEMFEFVAMM